MSVQIQSVVGPQVLADGALASPRMGKAGDIILSELHGRFYEQNYRGALYSAGMSALTSVSAVTFQVATLGATATPIVGIWNPGTSTVNAVVLQAVLSITLTALTAQGLGPFVWAASSGNNAITTGTVPWNRRTLTQSGSQVKNVSGVALTGLTNNLVAMHGSGLYGGSLYDVGVVGTAAGMSTIQTASVENIDGSIIVPPGAVLALLGTATPVAHSALSQMFWEEVAL